MTRNRVVILFLAGLIPSAAIADSGASTEPGVFDGLADNVLRDIGYQGGNQSETEARQADSHEPASQSKSGNDTKRGTHDGLASDVLHKLGYRDEDTKP